MMHGNNLTALLNVLKLWLIILHYVEGGYINIYVSVISDNELDFLRQNDMGYEITFYANAKNLDNFDSVNHIITQNMQGINSFSMHGSYDSVTYATNDPLILEITKKRFLQSIKAASLSWG